MTVSRKNRRKPTRVEQARLRQQAASPGAARSLAEAAAVRDATPARPSGWPVHALLVVAALVVMAGVYLYGPWARVGGVQWPGLLGAVVLSGAAGWQAWRWRARAGRWRWSAIGAVALVVVFVVGSSSSVTIDGRVQFAGGDTAEAVALIRTVQDDLSEIASYDELLRHDTAVARVEIDRYRPAAQRLAELAGHYASMRVEELPSDQFVPVLRQVAAAADFGSRALEGKRDLTLQYDARLEANVISWHETYTQAVLTAGPQLSELARLHGFDLVDPERDPVE